MSDDAHMNRDLIGSAVQSNVMTQTIHDGAPVWTTRRLLIWTTRYFEKKRLGHPRLAAEMLLAHVLGVPRLKLYMDSDRPASELERAAFRNLVERAVAHEPVDYLVGCSPFFSMLLEVNPTVFIPRPCTEMLVEHVVQYARRTAGFHAPLVADVGTGCGAIAVAVAKHVPHSHVIATDLSAQAMEVACRNAKAHGVEDRVEFRCGKLLEPLGAQRVRFLLSNPPYVSDEQWLQLPTHVKHYEPETALRGGVDGLRYLGLLIAGAREHLEHPGQLVLEIASTQKDAVLQMAQKAMGLANACILADHEGFPRMLVADTL